MRRKRLSQRAYPFLQVKPVRRIRLSIKPGKGEREDPQGQRHRYSNSKSPQPPLLAFDPAHLRRDCLGAILAYLLECLLIHARVRLSQTSLLCTLRCGLPEKELRKAALS